MANLRSVNTKFWKDPWVESLNVSEKLLFLYLITNGDANLAGIYEITIRRISFETGLNQETIRKGLEGFGRVRKAYFVEDNYIFLPNWLKNQNLNGNMKKGVVTIIKSLPKEVKVSILGNHYLTIQEDYQMVLNTLLKYEVEVLEDEREVEEEVIKPIGLKSIPSFEEFKKYALENEPNIDIHELELKYKSWIENKWRTGKNVKITVWKSTLLNTIPHIKKNSSNSINNPWKQKQTGF